LITGSAAFSPAVPARGALWTVAGEEERGVTIQRVPDPGIMWRTGALVAERVAPGAEGALATGTALARSEDRRLGIARTGKRAVGTVSSGSCRTTGGGSMTAFTEAVIRLV
jgi:hypothetical protein